MSEQKETISFVFRENPHFIYRRTVLAEVNMTTGEVVLAYAQRGPEDEFRNSEGIEQARYKLERFKKHRPIKNGDAINLHFDSTFGATTDFQELRARVKKLAYEIGYLSDTETTRLEEASARQLKRDFGKFLDKLCAFRLRFPAPQTLDGQWIIEQWAER